MAAPRKAALSELEIAELAGVSVNTWRAHAREGAPAPAKRTHVAAWLRRYHAWRRSHGKVSTVELPPAVDPEAKKWATERAKYLAINARLTVSERMGQLLPRDLVEKDASMAALTVRNRLNDMVRKMASRLFGAPSEVAIEEALQAEVDDILRGFARGLTNITAAGGGSSGEGDRSAVEQPEGLSELRAAQADDGERVG